MRHCKRFRVYALMDGKGEADPRQVISNRVDSIRFRSNQLQKPLGPWERACTLDQSSAYATKQHNCLIPGTRLSSKKQEVELFRILGNEGGAAVGSVQFEFERVEYQAVDMAAIKAVGGQFTEHGGIRIGSRKNSLAALANLPARTMRDGFSNLTAFAIPIPKASPASVNAVFAKASPSRAAEWIHAPPVGDAFPIETDSALEIRCSGLPDSNPRNLAQAKTRIRKRNTDSFAAVLHSSADRITRAGGEGIATQQVRAHVCNDCGDPIPIDFNSCDMCKAGINTQQRWPAPPRGG